MMTVASGPTTASVIFNIYECSREVQQRKPALRDIFSPKCLLFVENNQIAISRELGGVTSCARDMLQP